MSSLTIATSTFYNSTTDLRFELAQRFVRDAVTLGHRVVIVDASPLPEIANILYSLGATVSPQNEKGMGRGRRQALREAMDLENSHTDEPVVAWCEPEKYPLVPFFDEMSEFMWEGEIDLLIPRRHNLDGYPKYQQLSELRGNWQVGTFTGQPELDLWFGPRLMNDLGLSAFLEYEGDHGDKWDSIFAPVARAIAAEMSVESYMVNYVHPPEQTAAEVNDEAMDRKRDEQFDTLIECMRKECIKGRLYEEK